MTPTTATRPTWLENFSERTHALASSGPQWVRDLRRDGLARFEALGLPGPRLEQWRATNLAPIGATSFRPPAGAADPSVLDRLDGAARVDLGGPRLVFLDGSLSPGASAYGSRKDGLWVGPLARALEEIPERIRPHLARRDPARSQVFDALNLGFLDDGAVVLADDGAEGAAPVQLLFVSSGGDRPLATHPRTLVVAGRGSRLRVVETHVGAAGGVYLSNAVTDVVAGDNASIDHYRIQLESPRAFHVANVHTRQTRDSRIRLTHVDLGGKLVRNDVVSVLDGEGADCRLDGLYLTRDEQHVDNHTVLDHAMPHGSSRELYKGVLDGRSRTVFNGRIVVRRDAQKTDAKQSNPNLIVSSGALAHTRPQLEIYADDVKCTHGATIGRLDEEAVFYLRSRGIGEIDARNLMIASFVGEILDRIEFAPLRSELERVVAARLRRPSEART